MEKIHISQIGETNEEEDQIIKNLLKDLPHTYSETLTFSASPVSELVITFMLGTIASGVSYDMIKLAIQQLIHHPLLKKQRRSVVGIVETSEKQAVISDKMIVLTERTEKTIQCDSIDQAFELLKNQPKDE